MLIRFGITLLLLTSLLASFSDSASAASAQHGKTHAAYRSNKGKVPPRKTSTKVQQHFSFISQKQPSAVIQKLQVPLQGRVVQQQASPETLTNPPSSFPAKDTVSAPPHPAISPINVHEAGIKVKAKHSVAEQITSEHSWIEHISTSDIARLSELTAHWIQTQISKPNATLVLADPPQSQAKSTLIPSLAYVLEKRGYTIARKDTTMPDVYRVRYRIRAFKQGLLVQIKINGQESSRLYLRSQSGALVAASPMTQFKVGGNP
jgi:hypothetical protein